MINNGIWKLFLNWKRRIANESWVTIPGERVGQLEHNSQQTSKAFLKYLFSAHDSSLFEAHVEYFLWSTLTTKHNFWSFPIGNSCNFRFELFETPHPLLLRPRGGSFEVCNESVTLQENINICYLKYPLINVSGKSVLTKS